MINLMPKIIKKATKEVVTDEEVIAPVEVPIEETQAETSTLDPNGCASCNGTGKQNSEDLCVICQGSGRKL